MRTFRLKIDRGSLVFLASSFILGLIQIWMVLSYSRDLPPQIPLFYSLPWGNDRLSSPIWLWLLPAISIGSLLINAVASQTLRRLVLTRILASSAFLVSLLTLITLTRIILIGLP